MSRSPRRPDIVGSVRPVAGHAGKAPLAEQECATRVVALQKLISGGQTGVDRAALDVALELGIPCGGWCPLGRRAEDGVIPDRYPLRQAPSANYADRTALNVRDSDGTLILARGPLRGGTALTKTFAERYGRPYLVVDPHAPSSPAVAWEWLRTNRVRVLNVAGPRESLRRDVGRTAASFLRRLLARWNAASSTTKHSRGTT